MEFRESSNEKRVKDKQRSTVAEAEVVELETAEEPIEPTESAEELVAEVVAEPKKAKTQNKPAPKPKKAQTSAKWLGLSSLVYYVTGGIEVFLALRLLSLILNPSGSVANQNGGTLFIYNIADPLTRPFYDLFNTTGGHEPGVAVVLTAMIVYGLIGWGLIRLLRGNQS
jgi:hypothetical protein